MTDKPKWQGRVHIERGGVTPKAPTTGFKPSTGGSAVVKPAASGKSVGQDSTKSPKL